MNLDMNCRQLFSNTIESILPLPAACQSSSRPVSLCLHIVGGYLMWDSLLCAISMFYYPILIKKLLWYIAGQNIAMLKSFIENRWSQRDAM